MGSDVIPHIWRQNSRVNDRDTRHANKRFPVNFVSLLLFISFWNAFLSRRYVFESAKGDLEIMTIFLGTELKGNDDISSLLTFVLCLVSD